VRVVKRDKKKRSYENSAKKTCGSTVFSTGHPRQYSLAPAMLVCADRTRRGMFIAVWPQMRLDVPNGNKYPSSNPRNTQQSGFLGELLGGHDLVRLGLHFQDVLNELESESGKQVGVCNGDKVSEGESQGLPHSGHMLTTLHSFDVNESFRE
jgi:hypothetical protein